MINDENKRLLKLGHIAAHKKLDEDKKSFMAKKQDKTTAKMGTGPSSGSGTLDRGALIATQKMLSEAPEPESDEPRDGGTAG